MSKTVAINIDEDAVDTIVIASLKEQHDTEIKLYARGNSLYENSDDHVRFINSIRMVLNHYLPLPEKYGLYDNG